MTELDKSLHKELKDIAETLARPAGALALEMRANGELNVDTKTSNTDMITAADKAAEKLIVSGLGEHRPEDGMVGEEGTSVVGTSGITWHIDPIDGTTNFIYGREFGVSLGAFDGTQLVAGVVYDPTSDTCYSATLDGGAFANDSKLTASSPESFEVSIIATGFSRDSATRYEQGKHLAELLPRINDLRKVGAASLELCAVAAGKIDGYYENGLKTWDVAAGLLIAQEAGALVTPFAPEMTMNDAVVACSPVIFDEVKSFAEKL